MRLWCKALVCRSGVPVWCTILMRPLVRQKKYCYEIQYFANLWTLCRGSVWGAFHGCGGDPPKKGPIAKTKKGPAPQTKKGGGLFWCGLYGTPRPGKTTETVFLYSPHSFSTVFAVLCVWYGRALIKRGRAVFFWFAAWVVN